MEDIEKVKKQFIEFFSEKFYKKKSINLTELEGRKCSSLAELWAYVYKVVPEGHGKYTIFDFDGTVLSRSGDKKEGSLPVSIALDAKNKVCDFCWGIGWEEISKQGKNKSTNSFLRRKSVMMDRFKAGCNIAIFGSSDKPIGRTMLASIVMKEAIKIRITHGVRGQSYDWIDFSKLFNAIDKGTDDLVDYKSCDWLVVDNIINKVRSPKQTTLVVDLVDPFFISRYHNKQPTILVFKFDIRDKNLDIEKTFGVGVSKILNSTRTLKIPLSEYILSAVDD